MKRLTLRSLCYVVSACSLAGMIGFVSGCNRDEPAMVDYSPAPDRLEQEIAVPAAGVSKMATSPAHIIVDKPVAAGSALVFRGEITADKKGAPLPGAFVVELNRGGLTCNSGSAYGELRGQTVSYRIAVKAPPPPGRYSVEISTPGEAGKKIIVAQGEIEVE